MSASAGQQQAVPLATQAASGSGSALPIQDQLTLLQFRYTAALEKLVHANDQVAKLAEEKASLVADRAELQLRVQALLNGQQQHQQQPQGLDGSQQHHHQPHHPQQGDFQLDPALAMSSGYGVPGPSSQGAYGGGGFAQPHGGHQPTHGHRQIIYVAQPPPGPSLQQLEAARQKYDVNWNPFEGLSDEDLRQIRENTPNWDVKHLTRKSIWSELTDRNGNPVMRKPYPNEDPKAYSAEKSKCQEWHRIFVLARETVKQLLVPGTTWTEQNEEMRGFAVQAIEQKVDQVRWCQDHWKAQILLDSRLVEWNRSWKDKQAVLDGLGSNRRAKRRKLAKEKSGDHHKDDGSGGMHGQGGVDGQDDDDGEGEGEGEGEDGQGEGEEGVEGSMMMLEGEGAEGQHEGLEE